MALYNCHLTANEILASERKSQNPVLTPNHKSLVPRPKSLIEIAIHHKSPTSQESL